MCLVNYVRSTYVFRLYNVDNNTVNLLLSPFENHHGYNWPQGYVLKIKKPHCYVIKHHNEAYHFNPIILYTSLVYLKRILLLLPLTWRRFNKLAFLCHRHRLFRCTCRNGLNRHVMFGC